MMSNIDIPIYIKSIELEATITRANGDVEPARLLAAWYRDETENIAEISFEENILKRLIRRFL